ncbi:MAG TPA: hypothetical protein VG820_01745, partial [Fimbriimonadaceae bacterium]|nr:hypothetical protein [Fimbriimonadaceae bacterium]
MIPLLLLSLFPAGSGFRCPAGFEVAKVVAGGTSVLPNGRLLTPIGERLYTGEDLWKVVCSPDGSVVVGIHDRGFTVYAKDHPERQVFHSREIAPAAAFTPEGKSLLVSEGDEGELAVYSVPDYKKLVQISVNTDGFKDSYLNDVVVRGNLAYCVDIANQVLVTIDLAKSQVVNRIKAGREPYSIALSEDGKRLYVANIGLFDYSIVPHSGKTLRGLSKPPFAFPSPESKEGVTVDGTKVPGIG